MNPLVYFLILLGISFISEFIFLRFMRYNPKRCKPCTLWDCPKYRSCQFSRINTPFVGKQGQGCQLHASKVFLKEHTCQLSDTDVNNEIQNWVNSKEKQED